MRAILILTLALGICAARGVTIDAVYFGQTHVLKSDNPYFGLVGSREALIKVHVTDPTTPASPAVSATLTLNGQNLVLPLTGPATLPASIPDGLGVVQHSSANAFTGILPAAWVKKGLQVSVNAGPASASFPNLNIGAPTKVIMTMFDVQYFWDTNGDYPSGTFAEIEAKWPVASLEVRRLPHVIFPELVIPPRGGAKSIRLRSSSEYTVQTGLPFDGEQAAALVWNRALKWAAGRSGRWSLYYTNVYNAAAGGQAGGFAGVGNGTSVGVLHHELGHALSLPHWGDTAAYPYKGAMYGIQPPVNYKETHAGPAWAFDLRTRAFIPPTTQTGNAGGKPVGTYKVDPMEGGGNGWQEPTYLMNHFSDYSVNQMRTYLHSHVVVWNPALNSYASWNQTTGDYTTTVTNNGVQFPVQRDAQVISILASISGAKPDASMVYPPIGPYTAGLIKLFDATNAADRALAKSIFSPATGSDLCVRVVQGGIQKTYILAASWDTTADPYDGSSLVTEAVNLPAADGAVTKVELLLTPEVQDNGLPANPQVLYTWALLMPDTPTFASPPTAHSSSAITMTAAEGLTANSSFGPVEYFFTETTGHPGANSSGWQSSRSYTDTGLQPGTSYSYTVSMRAGTLATVASAAASAVTPAPVLKQAITVNATQQFTLQIGNGVKTVNGLGTFNAAGADKLVVVLSTEDANNSGIGYIFDVRYNGQLLTQAIQEDAGSASGTAAIFYLDNPGPIGTGTIEVSGDNPNGGIGAAYALSNTLPGFGASNSITGSTINSVNLTTAGDRSLVIAVVENSGKPRDAGTASTTASLTQVSSGSWGVTWGAHASGYRQVASPSAVTPAFTLTTGAGYSINIAAVEFLAKPVPPSTYATWAATHAASTTPAQDQDGDGISNGAEYLLGGTAFTNDAAKLPAISTSGGNALFTFQRDQTSISASTVVTIQVGTTLLSWPDSYLVGSDTATSSAGVTVIKGVPVGFDTITLSVPPSPDTKKFIRLSVTVTP
jgi:hypothetical protein